MENLDQYFGNVCELDIVFNFHKVYGILDEIIVGGEVLETAKDVIVNSIKNLEVEDWSYRQYAWGFIHNLIYCEKYDNMMRYHISTDAEVASE